METRGRIATPVPQRTVQAVHGLVVLEGLRLAAEPSLERIGRQQRAALAEPVRDQRGTSLVIDRDDFTAVHLADPVPQYLAPAPGAVK